MLGIWRSHGRPFGVLVLNRILVNFSVEKFSSLGIDVESSATWLVVKVGNDYLLVNKRLKRPQPRLQDCGPLQSSRFQSYLLAQKIQIVWFDYVFGRMRTGSRSGSFTAKLRQGCNLLKSHLPDFLQPCGGIPQCCYC